MNKTRGFRIALLQLNVTKSKIENIKNAISNIKSAVAEHGAQVVALPECFNSPYGNKYFDEYSEVIPGGETSTQLSNVAKELKVYIIGGTIPEKDPVTKKLYNTCTIWSPEGELIDNYRKLHLYDIDIPNGITFTESDDLTKGNKFTVFDINNCRIGIGICHDMRFDELSRIYRNKGCDMLVYPGAFSVTTGELHWELLARARANDNQVFVATISPARDVSSECVAWGHSLVVDPWGKVLQSAELAQTIVVQDIDFAIADEVRAQIPIFRQRRTDLYESIDRSSIK